MIYVGLPYACPDSSSPIGAYLLSDLINNEKGIMRL
jgi:hypothetical protein